MPRKPKQIDLVDELAKLNEFGQEVGDPKPVALPIGFKRPETLAEQVQRLVRTSVSQHAAAQGYETFEEAEDFDVEDEDPSTPYETYFDPILGRDLSPAEFRAHEQRYRQRYIDAQREYFAQIDRAEVLRRPAPSAKPSGGEATASGSAAERPTTGGEQPPTPEAGAQ